MLASLSFSLHFLSLNVMGYFGDIPLLTIIAKSFIYFKKQNTELHATEVILE